MTGLLCFQKPNPQTRTDPLANPEAVGVLGEGEKVEEVESEEAAEMTLTGTVVCRRSVWVEPGL